MDRQHILAEIRRTAEANGGKPLGVRRLDSEAGIKEHHWQQYWPRLSDAQREAGLDPNSKTEAFGNDRLVALLVGLARELGRFPTQSEIQVKCNGHDDWPSSRVFDRSLGNKAQMMGLVAEHCRANPGNEDVLALCASAEVSVDKPDTKPNTSNDGFVYLMKSGRFYKIGKTNHVGRRERELAIQLPDAAATVHSIKTDDPDGIEAYWHRRFAAKRKNGEWFDLDRADVAAFRRRKFM